MFINLGGKRINVTNINYYEDIRTEYANGAKCELFFTNGERLRLHETTEEIDRLLTESYITVKKQ